MRKLAKRAMRTWAALLTCVAAVAGAGELPAEWSALAAPTGYAFERRVARVREWMFPDFTVEFYRQIGGEAWSGQ